MRIVMIIGTILLLHSCSKVEYNLNPWTTVLKEVVNNGK